MDKYIFFTVDEEGDVHDWLMLSSLPDEDAAMKEAEEDANAIGTVVYVSRVIGKVVPNELVLGEL